jgi:hypothetical protein
MNLTLAPKPPMYFYPTYVPFSTNPVDSAAKYTALNCSTSTCTDSRVLPTPISSLDTEQIQGEAPASLFALWTLPTTPKLVLEFVPGLLCLGFLQTVPFPCTTETAFAFSSA